MNYLAHLFLAHPSDEGRIGSLLADFTIGTIDVLTNSYGEQIGRAIKHHREIDRFTDSHPAVLHASAALGRGYGIYSGIIIDVVFDHFLLRYWERFSSESLEPFFDSVYASLARSDWDFPQRYRLTVGRMIEKRWLGSYIDMDTVGFALRKIGERFKRETPLDRALIGVREHYDLIEADFLAFFPKLVTFSDQVHRDLEPQ